MDALRTNGHAVIGCYIMYVVKFTKIHKDVWCSALNYCRGGDMSGAKYRGGETSGAKCHGGETSRGEQSGAKSRGAIWWGRNVVLPLANAIIMYNIP